MCKMNEPPDLDAVVCAVESLYCGGAAASKANQWLGQLQSSVHAWSAADRLLAAKRSPVCSYFAAQTMRTKVQYAFHELPSASYAALRDSLTDHISTFPVESLASGQLGETGSVILTQLCLALVDLYLQVPQWSGFVSSIFDRFSKDENKMPIMLHLLHVIPEEKDSKHLQLGAARKRQIASEMSDHFERVLTFTLDVCQKCTSAPVHNEWPVRALRCASVWLSDPACSTNVFAASRLLVWITEALHSTQLHLPLHDACTELLCTGLVRIERLQDHMQLATVLHQAIGKYNLVIQQCIAMEDGERALNYARLFTELAESVLPAMVETPGHGVGSFDTLDVLFIAIGYHDYTMCEMTFNFWYRLSEHLYSMDTETVTGVFQPYVVRLIAAIYRHCRFDTDHEGAPEESGEFCDFRSRAAECLKDVIFVVGSQNCVNQMFDIMRSLGSNSTWDETESALFVVASIARCILPDELTVVPEIVGACLQLEAGAHVALRHTAVTLVGELHDWFFENDAYLERAVLWTLTMFGDKRLCATAAGALELLGHRCRTKISAPLFESMANATLSMAARADNDDKIAKGVAAALIGCASVLNCLPGDMCRAGVSALCDPSATQLSQLVASGGQSGASTIGGGGGNNENVAPTVASDPIVPLDRLSAVLRCLEADNDKPRPWLEFVQQLWPTLLRVLRLYEHSGRAVEHCCRTLRFGVRSAGGPDGVPLLRPLAEQLVQCYAAQPHSSLLYLTSVLVDEYCFDAAGADVVQGLHNMVAALSTATFSQQFGNNVEQMRQHPDTIDDYYRLCMRFVQRHAEAFFQGDVIAPGAVSHALLAMQIEHSDANKSVVRFIVESLETLRKAKKQNVSTPGVQRAEVLLIRPELVRSALHAAVVHLSRSYIRGMAEVLYSAKAVFDQNFAAWLQTALNELPDAESAAAAVKPDAKILEHFHTQALRAKDDRAMGDALKAFVALCR